MTGGTSSLFDIVQNRISGIPQPGRSWGAGSAGNGSSSRTSGGVSGNAATAMGVGTSSNGLLNRINSMAAIPVDDYVSEASADTGTAWDKSLGSWQRNLQRMGVNPASGAYSGLMNDWAIARSAAEAGAMTRARRQQRQETFGRMLQAVQLQDSLTNSANSRSLGWANVANQQEAAKRGYLLDNRRLNMAGDQFADQMSLRRDQLNSQQMLAQGNGSAGGGQQYGIYTGDEDTYSYAPDSDFFGTGSSGGGGSDEELFSGDLNRLEWRA